MFIGILRDGGPPPASKMHALLSGFGKQIYIFAERGAQFHRDPRRQGTPPLDGVPEKILVLGTQSDP